MNRIYQGRVSNVELPDGKGHWKPLDPDPKIARDKWQALLPVAPKQGKGGMASP